MDNIQIRFTPVQVKINNDDTLLHYYLELVRISYSYKSTYFENYSLFGDSENRENNS